MAGEFQVAQHWNPDVKDTPLTVSQCGREAEKELYAYRKGAICIQKMVPVSEPLRVNLYLSHCNCNCSAFLCINILSVFH